MPSGRSTGVFLGGLALGRLEHLLERLDEQGLQRDAACRRLDLEATVQAAPAACAQPGGRPTPTEGGVDGGRS